MAINNNLRVGLYCSFVGSLENHGTNSSQNWKLFFRPEIKDLTNLREYGAAWYGKFNIEFCKFFVFVELWKQGGESYANSYLVE